MDDIHLAQEPRRAHEHTDRVDTGGADARRLRRGLLALPLPQDDRQQPLYNLLLHAADHNLGEHGGLRLRQDTLPRQPARAGALPRDDDDTDAGDDDTALCRHEQARPHRQLRERHTAWDFQALRGVHARAADAGDTERLPGRGTHRRRGHFPGLPAHSPAHVRADHRHAGRDDLHGELERLPLAAPHAHRPQQNDAADSAFHAQRAV